MNKKIDTTKQITVFENKEVRRAWHNEQWYFAIVDVVQVLTDSKQPEGYIKDMRRRDEELSKGWGQIATPLSIETKGGVQKINCSNLMGIFRIIQSIPSPKAEPFKRWLAKVGQERVEEIQDPERAVLRAKHIYEQKGHTEDWIAKRMRGINVRNTLTDEWKDRGAKEGLDFAILTNEIYQGTFDMNASEIKDYKRLLNKTMLETT
jgi:prophage antirepressor-like protein